MDYKMKRDMFVGMFESVAELIRTSAEIDAFGMCWPPGHEEKSEIGKYREIVEKETKRTL